MEAVTSATNSHFDLMVVGAGPAGSAAAITAARGGAKVLLCERGRFPRQRVCGEFVSAESLELLNDLLRDDASALLDSAPDVATARLFAEGHVITTPVKPAAVSIARFDLDLALWQTAANTGVRALAETTVEHIEGNGPFSVVTNAGTFTSDGLINASGRWSNLTRPGALAHDHEGVRWLGVKAHFAEPNASDSVDLYFFEGGYCGVQPVRLASGPADHRINACAMVRADRATTLAEVFKLHPALAERSRDWQPLMEPVATSPLVFREPAPLWDGMFLAGDAAGFVDPFVGDGISLALRSGVAAADCLLPFIHHKITLAEAQLRYAEAYRQRLAPIFRNSRRLRRLFQMPRSLRRPLAYFFERTPALTSYLVTKTR